jgi:hypothetical protein
MTKLKTWVTVAALTAAAPAMGGEVTGNGKDTPIRDGVANSICAFSGQNDDGAGPNSHVQNYGVLVAALGRANVASPPPGISCRGN